MFTFRTSIFLAALLPMLLSGCAGTTNAPNSAAQIEKIDFVPDPTPMPDSMQWIAKAKDKEPAAMFILSMMYRDNIGGVDHLKEGQPTNNTLSAFEMKRERVHYQSEISGQHLLASFVSNPTLFYTTPDFLETSDADKDAIAWLEEAAKRGYGNAEYVLGMMYWNGVAVPADKARAFELIQRAAAHGIPNAQYHLGMIYEMGLERPADTKLANAWLQKALDGGNKDASFILAMKYADGLDMPKDLQKADEIDKNASETHPWPHIRRGFPHSFDVTCSFNYDIGTPENRHERDCGDEGYDPELEAMLEKMTEEEREHFWSERDLDFRAEHMLDYGIDFELASRWLVQAAQDPSHIEARLQLARLQEADCRFNSDLNAPAAEDILRPIAENNYPHTKLMLAELYKEYSCGDSNKAKEALKWYLSAEADKDTDAASILAEIYNDNYDYHCILKENDIKPDRQKSYEYALKAEDFISAATHASEIAEDYRDNKDYINALKWYQNAINASDNSLYSAKYYIQIAEIYDSGPADIQNTDKAFENYKQAAQAKRFSSLSVYDQIKLIRLAMLYDKGSKNIKPDKKLAIEWYKRGLEASYEFILNPNSDAGILYSTARKALLELPKIDLVNAVVDQIKLETGKDPAQFFSIKSALKPCLESNRGEEDTCPMLDPLYVESIQKAVTAITAITLAKTGKLDKDIILNTYYELAIIYGMDRNFKDKLRTYSPVYQKIHNETYYELPAREGNKIYNIWYLRQIPYAAAEVFKTLGNTSKAWDDYMKAAKKAVKSRNALKSGFGYNLTNQTPQPFQIEVE